MDGYDHRDIDMESEQMIHRSPMTPHPYPYTAQYKSIMEYNNHDKLFRDRCAKERNHGLALHVKSRDGKEFTKKEEEKKKEEEEEAEEGENATESTESSEQGEGEQGEEEEQVEEQDEKGEFGIGINHHRNTNNSRYMSRHVMNKGKPPADVYHPLSSDTHSFLSMCIRQSSSCFVPNTCTLIGSVLLLTFLICALQIQTRIKNRIDFFLFMMITMVIPCMMWVYYLRIRLATYYTNRLRSFALTLFMISLLFLLIPLVAICQRVLGTLGAWLAVFGVGAYGWYSAMYLNTGMDNFVSLRIQSSLKATLTGGGGGGSVMGTGGYM